MKIIGIYDEFGPSYHRVYVPLKLLRGADQILITNYLTDERMQKGCDILFFNRIPPANELKKVLAWQKKYGFKIVVDMDDHYTLDPTHIMYDYYRKNNIANRIIECLEVADAVTVTHERLGDAMYQHCKNIWMVPNAIPEWDQFRINRTISDKTRLFWAGSITHEHDIAILKNPIKRLAGSDLRDKIFMVMGGYAEKEPTWQRMVHAYTAGLRIPGNVQYSKKAHEYYSMYQYADICLIPLVENRFNSFKSNLKVLEAAHLGLPVIVSQVHPYLGFPSDLVNYVKKQEDWIKYIRNLVNNPAHRHEQGEWLRQWCQLNYNYENINATRLQLFESLCPKKVK